MKIDFRVKSSIDYVVFMKNFSCFLCLLCFTLPAFAQGETSFVSDDRGGWMVPFRDTLVLSDYEPDHSPIYKRLGTQHFFAIEVGFDVRF